MILEDLSMVLSKVAFFNLRGSNSSAPLTVLILER